ncbi:hypothetical protein H671_8g19288 [Cricetulus griseus]|nr:hypothetical protein H671_8g19288 [Cricetulus griseus]
MTRLHRVSSDKLLSGRLLPSQLPTVMSVGFVMKIIAIWPIKSISSQRQVVISTQVKSDGFMRQDPGENTCPVRSWNSLFIFKAITQRHDYG